MPRATPVEVIAGAVHGSAEYNNQVILQLAYLLGITLDGTTLGSSTGSLEIHNFYERTAPSTPASGVMAMYMDSADEHIKIKNSSGGISYWGQGWSTRKITLGANGEFDIVLADYEEATGATSMIIDYRVRSITAATNQALYMQFNGVTATTNYFRQSGGAGDGVALVGENGDQIIDFMPGSTSPANQYQRGKIFIHNLESGDGHVAQIMGAGLYDTGKVRNNLMAMTWNDTSAITSIKLLGASSTDIASGCWVKLSFMKGLS